MGGGTREEAIAREERMTFELRLVHTAIMTQRKYQIELGPVTEKNAHVVKVILEASSPMKVEASSHGQIGYCSDFAVGCICFTTSSDTLHVNAVAVLPAYRGLGLGSRMLEWAEARAKSDGLKHMRLHVLASSHEAKAFFESKGYAVKEISKDDTGNDTLLMSKEI